MKTFRYITSETAIDISMPSWLFYFFKKFSKVKTHPHTPGLKGLDFDLVCIDEAKENCKHESTWFDRTICPRKDGTEGMADICNDCGEEV